MSKECSCGCEALPYAETEMLREILKRKGFNCEVLSYCKERFDVIGHIADKQENQVIDLIESIKGVNFKYVVDTHATGFTVHCEINL